MKKLFTLNALLITFVLAFTDAWSQCYTPPSYCTTTATNVAGYGMGTTNVTLGTASSPAQVNNTTTANNTGPAIYTDYSNLAVTAPADTVVKFSITNNATYQMTYKVFIDYNLDGTFGAAAPELVLNSTAINAAAVYTGTFTVPTGTPAGKYRIRIVSDYATNVPTACGPLVYSSEAEDYSLQVLSTAPEVMSGNITSPVTPVMGNNTVAFSYTNLTKTTLTSLDIAYQVDGGSIVTQSLSGLTVAPGASATATFTTQLNLATSGYYNLKVWTANPNGTPSANAGNDTVCRTLPIYCSTALNGTYTINPAGSGPNNFKSIGAADSALLACGMAGPVVFNVTAGTYTSRLVLNSTMGLSPTKTLTINGNGATLQYATDATNMAVVALSGAKYVTINNLTVKPLDPTNAWGVLFTQNADSNTLNNVTIDFSLTTNAGSTAGIVFSASTNVINSGGANGKGNTITNCYIKGHASGGPYYGIALLPQTSNATLSGNKFINNIIENVYSYGMYMQYTYGTVVKGNIFRNPGRTSATTMYGIYLVNGNRADTVTGNTFTNPFGGMTTTTLTYYGIAMASTNAPSGGEVMVTNNILYNIQSNGPVYGIFNSFSNNTRYYHNSISLDHTGSTTTQPTYGIYITGTVSGIEDIKNNVISVTRGGTGTKYVIYLASASTAYALNNNDYYITGGNIGYYNGLNYPTFSDWRTANSGAYDAASFNVSPRFVNSTTGNLAPQEGFLDNKGANLLTYVPTDFTGAARTSTPDPGSYEFVNATATDAGVNTIVFPNAPFAPGSVPINVTLRNSGTTTLTAATINWTFNGVAQTPFSWTGSIAGGGVSGNILLGNITAAPAIGNNIVAWTSNPNGIADPNAVNDTAVIYNAYCTLPTGTYTINKNIAASTSNFQSFTVMAAALSKGGITGPVTINVAPNSGPYTEQVFMNPTIGSSVTNKVTINGNGQVLQFNNTDQNVLYILALSGTHNTVIDGLTIRALNANYGVGIMLMNQADSNTIQNCDIDMSAITYTGALSAGIAFTAAISSPTSTPTTWTGVANTIQNNIIRGGATGGPYYGLTLVGTNTSIPTYSHNKLINNDIRDFYAYGMYISYTTRTTIKGNTISRPTRNSTTTTYGMYIVNGSQADTIESNTITKLSDGTPTSTSTFYAINLSSVNAQAATPDVLRNNLIYDTKVLGPFYGIYMNGVTYVKVLHNTVYLNEPTSTSANITYGYYNTGTPTSQVIKNNIFAINKTGTGNKVALFFNTTTTTGYQTNNNAIYVAGSTNSYIGSYSGVLSSTLTAWKAAHTNPMFDSLSVVANPQMRTYLGASFLQPGNDSLNNIGSNQLADAPRDYTGAARTTTPDPGGYEFFVPQNDAGIVKLTAPLNPITLGFQPVNAVIKNYSPQGLLSTANIGWSVDGAMQSAANWFGALNPGDTISANVGNYNFATNGIYNIKVWSSLPNGVTDSFPQNDTISVNVCTPLAGTVTLNRSLPASVSNFTSFTSLFQTLQTCGVGGPLTVNLAPGTYTGQLTIPVIPGISGTNKLTFDGGDSALCKITNDGTGQRATLLLSGVKNLVFRNITFEATSASNATAVQLINAADSNTFVKCTFKALVTTSTAVNSFVASGSLTSATTTGNSANYLLVDSCTATGGYYGFVLYGQTGTKPIGNVIRNSVMTNAYTYGAYIYYQNAVTFQGNTVTNTGMNQAYTSPVGIYANSCDNGNRIVGNYVTNMLGGSGINIIQLLGTSGNRSIVANNMVDYGAGSNYCYGINESNNGYTDIAHNTVRINTTEALNAGGALYTNNTTPATYNNTRIVNNIFLAPLGAQAVYVVTVSNVGTAQYTMNNNVYYSTGTYPFRCTGFVTGALAGFATSPNMLGTVLPGNNTASAFFLPTFFSATNLRSISPQLDGTGMALSTVTTDIDGHLRNPSTPDIGLYEFDKPANDAGAVTILSPSQPVTPGLSDIKVLIRNFGSAALTSVDVNYKVGSSPVVTQTFTNTIAPGATDTVKFTATSGPGGTSQQYNFAGALETVKAWTSNPNGVLDSLPINDTAQTTICGGLSGNYTINPAGSGPNNFTNIQAAIDKLLCGGVYGPVVFDIAAGTYTGQFTIPPVTGTSAINNIVFKSAANNASSVTITSATSTASNNFTIAVVGAQYLVFKYLTLQNTNATYSRVVSLNKYSATNTAANDIEFRNCVFNGVVTTSTADQYALAYGPNGEPQTNIRFIGNTFNNGAIGITVSGPNVINQNAVGFVADSNTFTNQYYAPIFITTRFDAKIRSNTINVGAGYTGAYGIYISGLGQQSEISRNTIVNPSGNYGIYISTQAYYAAAGTLTIANNSINMQSTSATVYGISLNSSSQIRVVNNTVYIASTAASSAGLYNSGNASFVAGVTTYPSSNNISATNNLFKLQGGYGLYTANLDGNNSMNNLVGVDYNLYSTTGSNVTYLNGVNTTNSTFKSALYPGSDKHSLSTPITFTSATNLSPSVSDSMNWALNGRGLQVVDMTTDITGAFRSNTVATGGPDIGAYEFTPSVPAPKAVASTAPANSTTQYFTSFGDTVASVAWGVGGTVPTSFDLRYFSGANPPASTGYNVMNCYWYFVPTGGSSYFYDLNLRYQPTLVGTVPNESSLVLATKPSTSQPWSAFYSFNSTLDTVNKTMGTSFLLDAGYFTGTDINSPLPVTLSQFNAKRIGKDALLDWTTGSEVNSDRFVIERSFDGTRFEVAGEVKAAGNSSSMRQYVYTDFRPTAASNAKVVYYRLHMKDLDGSAQYSAIRTVKFDGSESTPTVVYPNPFTSDLNITVNALSDGKAQLRIVDIVGRTVSTQSNEVSKGDNHIMINGLESLQPGVYMIKMNVNGTEITEKVIKQ